MVTKFSHHKSAKLSLFLFQNFELNVQDLTGHSLYPQSKHTLLNEGVFFVCYSLATLLRVFSAYVLLIDYYW